MPDVTDPEVTQNDENAEVKKYPGQTGIDFPAYRQLVPEEVFTTTAEENGLAGEIYMILGTVKEYLQTDSGMAYWRVNTVRGDVIIADVVESYKSVPEMETLGEIDLDKMRSFYPMPCIDEYIAIFAEYQGMSSRYGCPHFIYASEDYLMEALLLSVTSFSDIADATTETEPSTETPTTEPSSASPSETKPTETDPPETTPAETTPPATDPPAITVPEETQPETTAPVETGPTTGEKNALKSANQYLRIMPFSHDGLINQLKYEGYTTAEATYAADNCGADWNEKALKDAKNYLDITAFSYSGLVEQLEYEKYTTSQATYAADHCGADWNEQALKDAKNYLDIKAFSYSGLIGHLEYEKYTTSQATYAADNCGADWYEQAKKSAADYLGIMSFTRSRLISQLEYEGFTHDQAVYGVEANGL